MPVGIQPDKALIDQTIGILTRDINVRMELAEQFKFFLDGATDPELAAMGYDTNDIALLRTVAIDMARLASVYKGGETVATVYDFRTFAKQVFGLGLTL